MAVPAGSVLTTRTFIVTTAASTEATDELRAPLHDAAIVGPTLLVGHSLAGVYARHCTIRFPSNVAGLLLLEAIDDLLMGDRAGGEVMEGTAA